MVVLVGLVIQITSEVLKVWNRSSGKLSANAEARIAMELLTQDLETAVFRNNGLRWLEAQTKNINSVAGYQPQTIDLLLFAPALDRPKQDSANNEIPGDICAIEYELVYQDPVSGDAGDAEDRIFALHRRVIDPATTFNELLGEGNQESFAKWKGRSDFPTSVALTYEKTSDPENYLSGNVANFRVKFYVIDDTGDEVEVTTGGDGVLFGGTNANVGASAPDDEFPYPLSYAEITLTILSDEGMEILRNMELGRGGTGYDANAGDDVVREHGEVFTRRVNFLARPL